MRRLRDELEPSEQARHERMAPHVAETLVPQFADHCFIDLLHGDKLMAWRWASNNSIAANVGMDYTGVGTQTAKNGEPASGASSTAAASPRTAFLFASFTNCSSPVAGSKQPRSITFGPEETYTQESVALANVSIFVE